MTLELINRNRHVRKALGGGSIFGPDISQLPARLVDACSLVQIERMRIEAAQHESTQEKLTAGR